MTTQIIGIREFRNNLSTLSARAQKKHVRYVVTNNNMPMFEVLPLDQKRVQLSLAEATALARADIKAGRVQSWASVKNELGLK